MKMCPKCGGSGRVPFRLQYGHRDCPECNGLGIARPSMYTASEYESFPEASDLRGATLGMKMELGATVWTQDDTLRVVDALIATAAGRALLRRKLKEHGGY